MTDSASDNMKPALWCLFVSLTPVQLDYLPLSVVTYGAQVLLFTVLPGINRHLLIDKKASEVGGIIDFVQRDLEELQLVVVLVFVSSYRLAGRKPKAGFIGQVKISF